MAKSEFSIDAKEFLKSLNDYEDSVDKKTKDALVKCA